MSTPPNRSNPEISLKLNHLRGSIAEWILRASGRLHQMKQTPLPPALLDELQRQHTELASHFSELELVLDHLRRRGEEAELIDLEKYGTGRIQIEADRFDIRDLEELTGSLRKIYEAILFAKTPFLPLDKLYSLSDFHLSIQLRRLDGAFVFHLKAPLLEDVFVPTMLEVARVIGIGEKSLHQNKKLVPLGWGPALLHVREKIAASIAKGESFQERLQESLDVIQTQLDDQLSPLADPQSLALPMGCLRTVAELLSRLLVGLKERGHIQVLRLSHPQGEMFFLDEVGREAKGPDGRSARDVLKEKVDRFVRISHKDS